DGQSEWRAGIRRGNHPHPREPYAERQQRARRDRRCAGSGRWPGAARRAGHRKHQRPERRDGGHIRVARGQRRHPGHDQAGAQRGSREHLGYYLSLSGQTEDGYYRNSATRYNQYGFRSNIDGRITDHLSLRFDVSGRLEDRNFPVRNAGSIFRELMRGKPNLPAYWPNGLPGPDIEYGDNPVVIGTPATGYDDD